jgi:hypothetical protein
MTLIENTALANLNTKERRERFDTCRAFGHSWSVRLTGEDDGIDNLVWKNYLRFDCSVCGAVRIDGLDAYNEVGQRRYIRPDGYDYPRGETPSRAEFRGRVLPRLRREARNG